MLPSDFNTSAYFDHHELTHAPEFFAEHGWSQLKCIKKCHLSLNQFMSKSCRGEVKNTGMSFDDVRWAWNAVNTRCVYLREKSRFNNSLHEDATSCSLAPLLDLLNHSCNVQVNILVYVHIPIHIRGSVLMITYVMSKLFKTPLVFWD